MVGFGVDVGALFGDCSLVASRKVIILSVTTGGGAQAQAQMAPGVGVGGL